MVIVGEPGKIIKDLGIKFNVVAKLTKKHEQELDDYFKNISCYINSISNNYVSSHILCHYQIISWQHSTSISMGFLWVFC